jgi:diketogulonate reductase-like aldo/keto reductase
MLNYYIVVGKLWNHYHAKANVQPAFDVTYKNFGLEYIDLYLVHSKHVLLHSIIVTLFFLKKT